MWGKQDFKGLAGGILEYGARRLSEAGQGMVFPQGGVIVFALGGACSGMVLYIPAPGTQ